MDDGSRPTANASLNEAELGEYCRRRGIYAEQLVVWRAACARANDWERAASRQIARETMCGCLPLCKENFDLLNM